MIAAAVGKTEYTIQPVIDIAVINAFLKILGNGLVEENELPCCIELFVFTLLIKSRCCIINISC